MKRNPIPTGQDFCEYEEHGIKCDMPYASTNEVFDGTANRRKSIQYGMQIKLCEQRGHHQHFHRDIEFQKMLKQRYQKKFENMMMEQGLNQSEARGVFMREFGRNYL